MTRVGICSTAHLHHAAYAPILQGMDGVEFLGVADGDEERGRSAAEALGCDYREPDELLDAADGVVVCSTNAAHREWIERAGERGTHVLSEKPLAPTVDEARAAVEAAEDAGIRLGVAMPLRFSEPIRRAEDALAAGELGDLYAISGTNRGEMPGGWFTDPEESGGGAIMDHTAHVVDVVHDLTEREVAEVYAESGSRFHDVPVEDVNVLSMTLEDGTQFLLDGSWSRPDEWPTWGGATLELQGRDGTMAVDCFGQTLEYVGSQGETDTETAFWGRDPNAGLIEDFVASLREGRDPEISGEEAVRIVAVIEAAYESVERGEPVSVE
ncbi:Gfo/Idh/MocA family protein [Halomicrobium urmianum]|uniref:Gfo/Idh/MocA family protein n=1 Tax=Halomicrobium urmianum TaxID=1586233 RepID=UPI001CDA30D3|nr:Gfo/Idh/MocA family oxidoreductase [Halomicrobium urmianum]